MAEKEEIDLDEKKPPKSKKNLIIYSLLGILLVGFATSTTLLFLGMGKGGGEEVPKGPPPAVYFPLESMVVNFSDNGPARFLQVDIQLMTRDETVISAVQQHMPVIRNDVLLLLSGQSAAEIGTLAGKEKLRNQVRDAVQRILATHAGMHTGVEAIYFTSFVMQ